MTLRDALSLYAERTEGYLQNVIEQLPDTPSELKAAMQYSLLNGGKRARPFLVYATGEMLGIKIEELDPLAASIECIHSYSLIHDDLPAMDNDELRRGKPTCHIAFNEATAILAGDALQTLAFDILSQSAHSQEAASAYLQIISLMARASGFHGMCGGQAMDLASTDKTISLSALQTLHSKKTGALIVAAVLMPAILGGCTNSERQQLQLFAENIGLAFQVQDDILDVTGDTQTLGKPQGSDQAANKSTYPSLLGLDAAKQQADDLYQLALQALQALPYNTSILREFAGYLVNRDN